MFDHTNVLQAYERIKGVVLKTPLEPGSDLPPQSSSKLFCKMENLQHTGSFKLRGASNKILSLTPEQSSKGVIAASNGNHGLAVAAAASKLKIPAEVYVSAHVSPYKAKRIEEQGASIRRVGASPLEAELAARAAAEQAGRRYSTQACSVVDRVGQRTGLRSAAHPDPGTVPR